VRVESDGAFHLEIVIDGKTRAVDVPVEKTVQVEI
jgi:hypothetical protein